jgi:hypothetical protein
MSVSRGTLLAVIGCVLAGAAMGSWSRDGGEVPVGKPVNLRVLPQDIPAQRLGKLMKRFEKELGVSCSYCHVENRDTGKLDYASDENPKKQTARTMITMLDDINDKYLAELGNDARYAAEVSCGSCHRGHSNPQPWEPGSP